MAGTLQSLFGTTVGLSGATLMARVRGAAGQLITQASLTSVAYVVTDRTTGTVGTSTALTVSAVVFNSLQQGNPRWTQDDANNLGPDGTHGYNFLATIPASAFPATTPATPDYDHTDPQVDPLPIPTPPRDYQVDVIFTPTSGEPWRVVWRLRPVVVFA